VTPDEHREAKELFGKVLEAEPQRRSLILNEACAGRPHLRHEVESLLVAYQQAGTFIDAPLNALGLSQLAAATSAGTMVGRILGPYRIEAMIGEGGMGAVYRATDTKLNRVVAVKFVSTEVADASARRRFQREAQLASSLNHPHILTVHDAGEAEGHQYLVTELVDGGTLRDWITSGTRTWRDIVELLIGVADGLATAHEAGVLHRDVKPENILVTRSGYAKLADFGLAKLHETPSLASRAVTETRTRPGAIVGTVAYMSPEQATGQPVDARSDVFSFAVVLYELLAGRRPFGGTSDFDVLQAIVERSADRLPESTPPPLDALITKALQKDPAKRVQSMRDLVADLRRLTRPGAETLPLPRHGWRALALAATVIALAIIAVSATILIRKPPGDASVPTQYVQLTNFADSATSPALSPDGRMLTFIRGPGTFFSPGQVYVKRLPDGEPVQLTDDRAPKFAPKFTPDGARISYATAIGLESASMDTWVVPVDGGRPQRLLTNAEGLTWFNDRTGQLRVLFSELTGLAGQMSIVSSTERRTASRSVYVPPPPDGMAHRSHLSPDGQWVLVVEMDIHSWLPCRLVPFDRSSSGNTVGPVPAQCTDAAWSPDGKWMYFTAMTANGVHLWRQRFPDGTPTQLTFGAVGEEGTHVAPDGGSFVTSIGTSQSTLWVRDAQGDRQITSEGNSFRPSISGDGKKLFYIVRSYGPRSWNQGALWVVDLETGGRRRLLPDFQILHYSISADGQRVVFVPVGDDGRSPLWVASLDGQTPPRQLTTTDAAAAFFGAPGEVLFSSGGPEDYCIYRIKESGGDAQKLIATPLVLLAVSPDGRWLAVQDPAAWGALIVYPAGGGSPLRLCDRCAPPWGIDPPPFYVGWTADSRLFYWSYAGATYAIPLPSGRLLPPLPAGGIQSRQAVAALPGARLISEQEHTFPGPSLSSYAFMKVASQRNIYRVPVP
jgi:eukaryotic-like serine/threonine-protein kinase